MVVLRLGHTPYSEVFAQGFNTFYTANMEEFFTISIPNCFTLLPICYFVLCTFPIIYPLFFFIPIQQIEYLKQLSLRFIRTFSHASQLPTTLLYFFSILL